MSDNFGSVLSRGPRLIRITCRVEMKCLIKSASNGLLMQVCRAENSRSDIYLFIDLNICIRSEHNSSKAPLYPPNFALPPTHGPEN